MRIFVGNLSGEATDAELRLLFAPYGRVESADVIKEKNSGVPRGFGLVSMPSRPEAMRAIEALQGYSFKGQVLRLNEVRPPDRHSGRGRHLKDDKLPSGG